MRSNILQYHIRPGHIEFVSSHTSVYTGMSTILVSGQVIPAIVTISTSTPPSSRLASPAPLSSCTLDLASATTSWCPRITTQHRHRQRPQALVPVLLHGVPDGALRSSRRTTKNRGNIQKSKMLQVHVNMVQTNRDICSALLFLKALHIFYGY
jgi:hypothetical protein